MSVIHQGCIPNSEAFVVPKSEAVLVSQLRRRGVRTSQFKGHHWIHCGGLFWQPVHWLARLPAPVVDRPHPLCLGYASTVREEDKQFAQGHMPLHLLSGVDLDTYDAARFRAKRRNQLRKALKLVEFVQIIDPHPHLRRLYEITCVAVARFRGNRLPAFDRFATGISRRVVEEQDTLIAGFVNATLAGYFLISCVDDVAYIDQVMLDTAYLPTDIGTGLTYETVMILKRNGRIQHVVYGRHSVEKPTLTSFKEDMGFKVVAWPVKFWLSPLLRLYLVWRAPEKLYRLTGNWPKKIGLPRDLGSSGQG